MYTTVLAPRNTERVYNTKKITRVTGKYLRQGPVIIYENKLKQGNSNSHGLVAATRDKGQDCSNCNRCFVVILGPMAKE